MTFHDWPEPTPEAGIAFTVQQFSFIYFFLYLFTAQCLHRYINTVQYTRTSSIRERYTDKNVEYRIKVGKHKVQINKTENT
jgi:hypothetical protein